MKLNLLLNDLDFSVPLGRWWVPLQPSDLMWVLPDIRLISTMRGGFCFWTLWVEKKLPLKIVKMVWESAQRPDIADFQALRWALPCSHLFHQGHDKQQHSPAGNHEGKVSISSLFSFPAMHEEGFKSRSHTTSLASSSAPTRRVDSSWQKWWASARKTWMKMMSCC